VATSDIDILCHAPDPIGFARRVWDDFHHEQSFMLRQWTRKGRPIIASFRAHGWMFEIFGAAQPVAEQAGWRHFQVQRRLLALCGPSFRDDLIARRQAGAKTEPAFAAALDLPGNPYEAMLELADRPDAALVALLAHAGFKPLR
jgi:hypothetical protein